MALKLSVVSDLHFEINGYVGHQGALKEGGDVLIIAGDLTSAQHFYPTPVMRFDSREKKKRMGDIRKFLDFWASKFRRVYYVLGNHEHYGCVFSDTANLMRNVFKDTNVRLLDDEFEEFEGILFYGSTMWTDFNRGNPLEMGTVQAFMNDYNWILRKHPDELSYMERNHPARQVNQGLIDAQFIYEQHQVSHFKMMEFLKANEGRRIVMITHHSPSYQCQNVGRHGTNLIHAYCNDFDHIMFDYENIELWCSGHSHDSMDFTIGKTRCYSNQLGYLRYEASSLNFKPKFIEL